MGKFRLFGLQTDEISDREIKHRKLAREVASEGMVLLKNEGILPLQPQKIALYGAGARMTVKGGTGSGNMQERYSVTIEEGLINAGFEIVSGRWLERFDESFAKEKEEWRLGIEEKIKHYKPWEVQKMFDEVIHVMPLRFPIGDLIQETDISAETDTAIYVIARQAGESADRKLEKGDYYLSEVEEKNLSFLADKYKKILLVINCGGILDMSVLDKVQGIGAVLHFVQGGEEGGMGREATDKELSGGVICDGIGSSLAALFGVLPNTSFSQNVGLVTMTKVVNRIALACGAVFLILCGLFPKLGALISIMPQSVLGGAAVMMFSSIIVSGIQLITKEPLDARRLSIVSVALGVGYGMGVSPAILEHTPQAVQLMFGESGIVPAAFVAILLNVILPKSKPANEETSKDE